MTANLTSPRPDISYLRRVPKRTDKKPTDAPKPAATSLSFSSGTSATRQEREPISIPVLPSFVDTIRLDAKSPLVQAHRRKSAIGSLVASGCSAYTWDLYSSTKSREVVNEQADMININNRDVISWHKENVVIALRHIKYIRRIILTPISSSPAEPQLTFHDGTSLFWDASGALVIYQVEGRLEFRWENIANMSASDAFNISSAHHVTLP